ncbi:MAG: Isopropylmalate/citramalate isomerase small subunit [Candidatus Lokiarchaeum sp. GC14_75]|nr:MAG: Isopropylmalate/citramalate isomerase small subunit [Candidatus Lokiarchaeum sp. GC14_75]
MFEKIVGLVYILGDDINTDDIVPSSALTLRDTSAVAQYTLKFIDPQFVKKVSKYNILIAGENFGTGSSREEAVNVFKVLGIKCVIARSFARIYFRNLINLGIPGIHLNWKPNLLSQDDKLEISLSEGVIFNITKDLKINFEKLPEFLTKILEEGGIINQLRKKLLN